MAANSWTREENEQFKNALKLFSAFSPARFQSMAEYLHKPLVHVKEHYEEMVDDLLEIGSNGLLSAELTEAMLQTLYQVERTVWNKEEHEWLLIGMKRFERDWGKIAVLLNSKNEMQVSIYAHNFFCWQKSMKNVIKQSRANDTTMMDTNRDPRGQQGSLFQQQTHPQQQSMVLDIGPNAKASGSKSSRP